MCASGTPSALDALDQVEEAIDRVDVRPASTICEPMWQSMPVTSIPGRRAARANAAGASSWAMPNLLARRPVEM
jgi:hypothetical protein